jgi:hypothetical protein
LTQVLRDVIGYAFGANEDQHLGILCTDSIEVLDQLCSLFEVTADVDNLLYVVVRCQFHRANVDLNHVSKEIPLQISNKAQVNNARKRTFASF